jgi:hypothetical protein
MLSILGIRQTLVLGLLLALTLPAAAEPRERDFDAGDADRLIRVSRVSDERPRRIIHARPLTTVRVDTASTRAVDRRRAAESGVVVRPTPRAYVVTNPHARRDRDEVQRPSQRAERYRRTSDRQRPSDLSPVRVIVEPKEDGTVETARFIDTRPDPVTDQVGNVRAQPSVARAHDGIEPANHRRIKHHRPRVTHVTKYTRPVHDLHVPGSGHEQWHTRTVPVHETYPRYRKLIYPCDHYFAGGHGGTAYGYREHRWVGYGPSYRVKAEYDDGRTHVDLRVGGH